MKADFWHERWEENQLGFHQEEVNGNLVKHWDALDAPKDSPAFVPLCGKSLDMAWLLERGHPVIGVELSPIACRDYFAGQSLEPTRTPHGALETWSAPGYTLHCGDFFALEPSDLEGVRGAFDRGSLVALPPEMRSRYAEHLGRILPGGAKVLLLTVIYDQNEMNGPPHSVPAEEVESLFGAAFRTEQLAVNGPGEPPPPFQARGMKSISEGIWLLERNPA